MLQHIGDWVGGGSLAGVVSSLIATGVVGAVLRYLSRYLDHWLVLRSRERMHIRSLEAAEARGVSVAVFSEGAFWVAVADSSHGPHLEQLMAQVAHAADALTRSGSKSGERTHRSPLRRRNRELLQAAQAVSE
jgi:hypothetical protein